MGCFVLQHEPLQQVGVSQQLRTAAKVEPTAMAANAATQTTIFVILFILVVLRFFQFGFGEILLAPRPDIRAEEHDYAGTNPLRSGSAKTLPGPAQSVLRAVTLLLVAAVEPPRSSRFRGCFFTRL